MESSKTAGLSHLFPLLGITKHLGKINYYDPKRDTKKLKAKKRITIKRNEF